MNDQEQLTKRALRDVAMFLGGPRRGNDEWGFSFGEHLRSNWGAVYGGATAAACLAVARAAAPDRSPRSLHIQMIRSVPCGPAFAVADVRHAGRAVATIQVDLYDQRRKLAAAALVTMVAPDAVVATHHDTGALRFQIRRVPAGYDVPAPISDALGLSTGGWAEVDNIPPSITGEPAAAVTLTSLDESRRHGP